MTDTEQPVVLIVEDERSVAEGYELLLQDLFVVKWASDGPEALAMIDDTVDVVLLDRMMPKMSGGAVLSEIRDRGLDCRVAMVTAVEPDFDIIEMGFDDYLTKPPSKEELRRTVARLVERSNLDNELQEYHSLIARKSALQTEKPIEELGKSEEYAALLDQIDTRSEDLETMLGDMSSDTDFVGAVREITDEK